MAKVASIPRTPPSRLLGVFWDRASGLKDRSRKELQIGWQGLFVVCSLGLVQDYTHAWAGRGQPGGSVNLGTGLGPQGRAVDGGCHQWCPLCYVDQGVSMKGTDAAVRAIL